MFVYVLFKNCSLRHDLVDFKQEMAAQLVGIVRIENRAVQLHNARDKVARREQTLLHLVEQEGAVSSAERGRLQTSEHFQAVRKVHSQLLQLLLAHQERLRVFLQTNAMHVEQECAGVDETSALDLCANHTLCVEQNVGRQVVRETATVEPGRAVVGVSVDTSIETERL